MGYVLAVSKAQRLGFSRVEDRVSGIPATSWQRLSAGDADIEERRTVDPSRGFVARLARFVATGRNPHAGELVGVVAGVLVDAGAVREIA